MGTSTGLRFASLGSGSRGNATLVESGETSILVDCGFSLAETTRRLERLGRTPQDLQAVLVTHEHSDHIGGVARLARRHHVPVWMTPGTAQAKAAADLPELHLFTGHAGFVIGEISIQPYPVPHDAREPAQFVFSAAGRCLGLLTDAGSITPHMVRCLSDCDALILECNHDEGMLERGPYPPYLRARVGGGLGHLNNHQAADLLRRLPEGRLQRLLIAHLSEKNNTAELALRAVERALGVGPCRVEVACQVDGSGWAFA